MWKVLPILNIPSTMQLIHSQVERLSAFQAIISWNASLKETSN